MKTKISTPAHSIENEISSEEMGTIAKLFGNATPSFIKDGIGILDDKVKLARFKNLVKITHKANEELKQYGVQVKPLSLKESVQFIEAASLEEDETLQGLYAKLLANANKENGKMSVFVSILKELTVEDAKVLQYFYKVISEKNIQYPSLFKWGISKNVFSDDNEVANFSFDNLMRQQLLEHPPVKETYDGTGNEKVEKMLQPTKLGHAFIIACNEVIRAINPE